MIKTSLVLFISVVSGFFLIKYPGAIVIAQSGYLIEIPMWISIFSILTVSYILIYFVSKIFKFKLAIFKIINNSRQKKDAIISDKIDKALFNFNQSNYEEAYNLIKSCYSYDNLRYRDYLFFLQLLEVNFNEKLLHYTLQNILNNFPRYKIASIAIVIRILLNNNMHAQALTLYNEHYSQSFVTKESLELLGQISIKTGNYTLLDGISNKKILCSNDDIYNWYITSKISHYRDIKNPKLLIQFWQSQIIKKNNSSLLILYIDSLIQLECYFEAEKTIRINLLNQVSPVLIEKYALCQINKPTEQIKFLQIIEKKCAYKSEILYAMSIINMRLRLWQAAKDNIFESITIKPDPFKYKILGDLYCELGNFDKGAQCYKQSALNFFSGEYI